MCRIIFHIFHNLYKKRCKLRENQEDFIYIYSMNDPAPYHPLPLLFVTLSGGRACRHDF